MSITVFYTPRMVADSQSYSASARKPEQVVQSWLQLGCNPGRFKSSLRWKAPEHGP
jgi:hypothetical protein